MQWFCYSIHTHAHKYNKHQHHKMLFMHRYWSLHNVNANVKAKKEIERMVYCVYAFNSGRFRRLSLFPTFNKVRNCPHAQTHSFIHSFACTHTHTHKPIQYHFYLQYNRFISEFFFSFFFRHNNVTIFSRFLWKKNEEKNRIALKSGKIVELFINTLFCFIFIYAHRF